MLASLACHMVASLALLYVKPASFSRTRLADTLYELLGDPHVLLVLLLGIVGLFSLDLGLVVLGARETHVPCNVVYVARLVAAARARHNRLVGATGVQLANPTLETLAEVIEALQHALHEPVVESFFLRVRAEPLHIGRAQKLVAFGACRIDPLWAIDGLGEQPAHTLAARVHFSVVARLCDSNREFNGRLRFQTNDAFFICGRQTIGIGPGAILEKDHLQEPIH